MRAWLFVLAVLVTFHKINQVASTEEARSSSINNNLNSNLDNSNSYNNINNNNNNNNKLQNKDETRGEKPDPSTLVEIEKNLLTLFGFKNRPKVDRSKVIIPEAMKQLYADIMGMELDSVNIPKPGLNTKTANTVRSFTHEESTIDNRFQHHHRFRLLFNVSSIPKEELLKAAELRLSRNAFGGTDLRRVRHQIHVYDILRPGLKGKREPIFLLIDTKTVKLNGSEPVSLDVVPAVERWLKTPKQNYGLLVHISTQGRPSVEAPSDQHIRLRRSVDESHETWAQNQPLLFTYTDDGRYKQRSIRDALAANRARRAPTRRAHRRKDGREICQRRPLYVDFTDVGWSDWIVAPPGYEAYYCHGECQFPLADHLNSTNHAVVQTLVNSYNPNLAPRACCVPTQLTSISMLYLDDQNKVVLKNYQDMTVVGCGCR